MVSGFPTEDIAPPDVVSRLAAGRQARAVWENELGGLTFEIGSDPDRTFVKWAPHVSGLDLEAETERAIWAADYTPVPAVLETGSDASASWMVTKALPGESAVAERWLQHPETAVAAIGRGLRALHDSLPVETCPFSWSNEKRLATLIDRGRLERRESWDQAFEDLTAEEALRRLNRPPAVDRLVVCHGDACSPNTLIGDDGDWTGHVDLGDLGVADRWADLAIATWSTNWNYGPGFEGLLLDSYGIESDPDRTYYYRLLWDLSP